MFSLGRLLLYTLTMVRWACWIKGEVNCCSSVSAWQIIPMVFMVFTDGNDIFRALFFNALRMLFSPIRYLRFFFFTEQKYKNETDKPNRLIFYHKKRCPIMRTPFLDYKQSNFFNDFLCRGACYSGEIASTGQTSAHEPQSVHNSGSIV